MNVRSLDHDTAPQRMAPERWTRRSRRLFVRIGGAALVTIAILAGSAGWWLPALGGLLALPGSPAPADVIVVLGGGFPMRDQHAIDLYREGYGREIWRTGETPDGSLVVQKARRLAIQQGVPASAFVPLITDSTWADGREIARMAQERKVERVLIVTDWPHSRRAMCVIKRHLADTGVVAIYDGPRNPPYTPADWWRNPEGRWIVPGELLKTFYYLLRFGVAPWAC
ncbi:MAG: YdcF family protein [Roseiflexus sp.]|nr:YdcF family protein [Roseiflexus sp.]MCS7289781.1 YdcF family protein [Roseiflexus sp.]MDW8145736.1 YdcF family protein [Roseiflexaceae bacterium]MDW8232504.1 YdcF family protein [Roseiflexaceae bacterium]